MGAQMYVVVWEPRSGVGGGHQLVMDFGRAEQLRWRLCHLLKEAEIRVLPASEHAAVAVVE